MGHEPIVYEFAPEAQLLFIWFADKPTLGFLFQIILESDFLVIYLFSMNYDQFTVLCQV